MRSGERAGANALAFCYGVNMKEITNPGWRRLEDGTLVGKNGKKIGRHSKKDLANKTKEDIRTLYNRAFDEHSDVFFMALFEQVKKGNISADLIKYLLDQRIGKPMQTVGGDVQAPISVVVRRGSDMPQQVSDPVIIAAVSESTGSDD